MRYFYIGKDTPEGDKRHGLFVKNPCLIICPAGIPIFFSRSRPDNGCEHGVLSCSGYLVQHPSVTVKHIEVKLMLIGSQQGPAGPVAEVLQIIRWDDVIAAE